jgi:5-methyltetrahydropteroyltriglutamate--homocysteine methyltransferase
LRPADVKKARESFAADKITIDDLHEVEDRAISRAIAKQEEIGLHAVTDGEYRRAFFNFDFLEHLEGVEATDSEFMFGGGKAKGKMLNVTGKVRFAGHPMLDQFKFLKSHSRETAKWTIPSPSMMHFRFGRKNVSESAYLDMDAFFDDVADAYGEAIKAFAAAGCRYLQIDECPMIYLTDPVHRKVLTERGEDPDEAIRIYAAMTDRAVAQKPEGMTITLHVCRGNYRSTHAATGSYASIAEPLFEGIGVDGYFLEYDSDRAGDFEPLKHVPRGKKVVLGLITSKMPELESRDDVKRRIDEAAKYVPVECLALSPQCGFASTEEGNALSEDEKWRKLDLVVDIADEVWGTA